jgi:mono/diheme cytochrome c family protein
MYVRSVQDHPVKVEGPVAVGAALYAKCAGCHGADGGGGAGRQLSNNEVMKTFPVIEDMLRWIAYGTEKYKAAGVEIYGNPNRDGGVHKTGSFGVMPGWQGELTDDQILAVSCYVRYSLGGADSTSTMYEAEFAKWCNAALKGGATFADAAFKAVGAAPAAGSEKSAG